MCDVFCICGFDGRPEDDAPETQQTLFVVGIVHC